VTKIVPGKIELQSAPMNDWNSQEAYEASDGDANQVWPLWMASTDGQGELALADVH
jgi:hypothetical protein